MDILTHTLSGIAVSITALPFFKIRPANKLIMVVAGAVSGAFPDIDAISMWSRFDGTFGRLFNLPQQGKVIYGEKLWYSHHAFFHSIVASLLFGLIFGLLVYGCYKLYKKTSTSFTDFFKSNIGLFVCFVVGYWAHLAEDLPTPSSVWGGIRIFWPSSEYMGGSGHVWWWNNYDIFLIVGACVVLNLIAIGVFSFTRFKAKYFTLCITVISAVFILFQIHTRKYDYAYSGNTKSYDKMEQQSKEEQQHILGESLFRKMERFDRAVRVNF